MVYYKNKATKYTKKSNNPSNDIKKIQHVQWGLKINIKI